MNLLKDNGEGLVTVRQAAEMLAVSPRTIWRMIADGQLRVVRLRGCTRLVFGEVSRFVKNGGAVACI
jgi:excisionase family DNA binding protein